MQVKIVKNKYLNTFFLLMLFSAMIHMLVLFALAITSKNIYVLNYFNILDLDLIFPLLLNNFWGNVASAVTVVLLYWVIFKFNQ